MSLLPCSTSTSFTFSSLLPADKKATSSSTSQTNKHNESKAAQTLISYHGLKACRMISTVSMDIGGWVDACCDEWYVFSCWFMVLFLCFVFWGIVKGRGGRVRGYTGWRWAGACVALVRTARYPLLTYPYASSLLRYISSFPIVCSTCLRWAIEVERGLVLGCACRAACIRCSCFPLLLGAFVSCLSAFQCSCTLRVVFLLAFRHRRLLRFHSTSGSWCFWVVLRWSGDVVWR
ncbi:hypothetical protein BDQ17DRAFT_1084882 [Cyathus striatus]|nr:hypothetical protein BDQ17DRAFT_1084882 [Cyathus striatus]